MDFCDDQGGIIVLDDTLDSNEKAIEAFYTRGRHKTLDVYYFSQSYIDLPKEQIETKGVEYKCSDMWKTIVETLLDLT